MADRHSERLVTAGRVGRAHGLDGSFRVNAPEHPLAPGTAVIVAGVAHTVRRRRGSHEQPIIALAAMTDREAAAALGGELLLVAESDRRWTRASGWPPSWSAAGSRAWAPWSA